MENFHGEQMELPPGFRFHPTDEELIIHYLQPKVYNINFSAAAVTKIDLNKVEPWDLPKMAKMGEDEWYFFSSKDKKYPTGSRTNRATEFGYWKATGKDKEICKSKKLIGMKKTLVFYKGRAPRGQRTNWVMHEYRLDKKDSTGDFSAAKTEWVISRIFHKDSTGKKTHISGLATTNNESQHSNKLPLVDRARISEFDTSHVTCFSGPSQYNKPYEKSFESLNPTVMNPSHLAQLPIQSPLFCPQTSFQDSNSFSFNYFSDNNGAQMKQPPKAEYSQEDIGGTSTDLSSVVFNHETAQRYWEDQEYPISFGGPLDTDCLWNY